MSLSGSGGREQPPGRSDATPPLTESGDAESRDGAAPACPSWIDRFVPRWHAPSLFEVTAGRLADLGITGVMLDLDNTLVEWHGENPSRQVIAWVGTLHAAAIRTCVVSNTHRPARLGRLCDRLGVDFILGVGKPGKRGFRRALKKLGTPPERTAVIGDQIFTDIWGGNRMGLYTILVPPLSPAEFFGTRWVSRRLERLLFSHLRRRGRLPPREPGPDR